MKVCPRCETTVEAHSRFCGVCGASLNNQKKNRTVLKTVVDPPGKMADMLVGATLANRFRLLEKIGQGGFGSVYKGLQIATKRVVAIKLLHPKMTQDPNVVERFRREGRLLCSLKDAHTVTTYDFDETEDGVLFMAMELLEGRSLQEVFTDEAPLVWPRVLQIICQMCSSLAEAHAKGIIHRDLKPENVHLEKRGEYELVKVLDFGIAKVLQGDGLAGNNAPQLTATGQTLGTLEYMSPEQLMGRALDGRSDMYSLGVLAYELLTGQLPFPDATGPVMLIGAQLRSEPQPPSEVYPAGNIPPDVDFLVKTMLGRRPSDRFADLEQLQKECTCVLQIHDSKTKEIYKNTTPNLHSKASRGRSEASAAPGPATQAIIEATTATHPWRWGALFVAVAAVVAAVVALAS